MFPRRKTRIGAAVVLAAALAIGLAAPAAAIGRTGWREAQDWADGFLPRVLAWLGLAPEKADQVWKCDHTSSIDPNGCPKAAGEVSREAPTAQAPSDGWRTVNRSGL